jgi:dihydrodipicolinate synthase/N-acetylneuraminate lyase
MHWRGVFPAITTPFHPDLTVDFDLLRRQVSWYVDEGCQGIVPLGSLGEGATLTFDEKLAVLTACREAAAGRAPVVPGIAALSTAEAVALARAAEARGCEGLMVLPPYVYVGDARETAAHFRAVIGATPLPCMLYNNPIAYRTDVTPEGIAELADLPNLQAVKESTGDVRRVTAIRALLGDRIAVFIGVDDLILEGLQAGATGWIAGLVDALPAESVRLFHLATTGHLDQALDLYRWFLPLLRLDTLPKFVQLIKLVETEVGHGTPTVRPPRLELQGAERDQALALIRGCLARRPAL